MQSRVKHIRDEDPAVELRASDAANYTTASTQNNTGVSLGQLVDADWDNGDIPWQSLGAQVVVHTIDFADNDGTYTLQLEIGDDESFSNKQVVSQLKVDAVGAYVMLFDADSAKKVQDAAYVRLNAVVTETTPVLGYYGWLINLPAQ